MTFGDSRMPDRIWAKIEPEPNSGCWLWSGYIRPDGYGSVKAKGRMLLAHRYVYESLIGPITKPTLDHRCRVRSCVNPNHLVPATMRENILAPGSEALPKLYLERTLCPDHQLPLKQTRGRRECAACAYIWSRRKQLNYERTHRAEINARMRRWNARRREKEMFNAS